MDKYSWTVRRKGSWSVYPPQPNMFEIRRHVLLMRTIYNLHVLWTSILRLEHVAANTFPADRNRTTSYPATGVGRWAATSGVGGDANYDFWLRHCHDRLGVHDASSGSYHRPGPNRSTRPSSNGSAP